VDGETFVGLEGQNKLATGMMVGHRAEAENGVFGSTVLEVVYDDEIEGPLIDPKEDPMDPGIRTDKEFGKTITKTIRITAQPEP